MKTNIVALSLLLSTLTALAQDVIDPSKVEAVKQCALERAEVAMETGQVDWRTITRYLAADNTESASATAIYTPCAMVGETLGGAPERPSESPGKWAPAVGDHTSSGIRIASGYDPIPHCDRYSFVGTPRDHFDGVEKFVARASIDEQGQLSCYRWTKGGGLGKGGGHVYAYCSATIRPVYDNQDMAALMEQCAQELLP